MIDLRSVCLARESPFISPDRKFEPLAEVSQDWSIPAIPPLTSVDLVTLARNLGNQQSGKSSLRNEDLIRRFVRSALEKVYFKFSTLKINNLFYFLACATALYIRIYSKR